MTDPYASSQLRYVDADQLDNSILDLDGLDVKNPAGDHLGDVDGLLVDTVSGRPRYLVVDSGGWFHSRQFLLPIGQARLDSDRRALRVDLDRDAINRFPTVDVSRYDRRSSDDWQRYDADVDRVAAERRAAAAPVTGEYAATPLTWWHTERWTAWARDAADRPSGRVHESRVDDAVARERTRTRSADEFREPAYGERAQPGDVLGIESSGETTGIGDTAADEDRRRESAERAVEKMDFDEDRKR